MFNSRQSQKSGDNCINYQADAVHNNTNNYYYDQNEKQDFGIIEEILQSLIGEHIPKKSEISYDNSQLTELKQKIQLNFIEENCRTMEEAFTHLWGRVQVVKKVIEIENADSEDRIIVLIDKIQSDYRFLKSCASHYSKIEYISVVEELAYSYLPVKRKNNPDYIAYSKAIVLYFFELCYFGIKTKNELKQPTLFDF
ncbi:MAG TPA: hypothetical protein DF637_02615 [Rikenellaceae bacterium]|jgi:hypothetical protein|nr:hypothetical protein [Rikenellaceae bacterium]